jgi:uncharacterized repeat protein (TIGR03803 family)
MKTIEGIAALVALLGISVGVQTATAQYTLLHTFVGYPSDGAGPYGSLTFAGSNLFGMTSGGGNGFPLGWGTVFKLNSDGTGHTILHNFDYNTGDAFQPTGSLTLSGSNLFGMTEEECRVFKINTDGTGYTNLHSFGQSGDGDIPYGSLTLSGSTLYGMTSTGPGSGNGTVFKINTDGTGYTILHNFTGGHGNGDGANPYGSLTLSGSTLFGMTTIGGSSLGLGYGYGTVFKINIDGSGFNVLHSFTSGSSDGDTPYGDLILSGSTLYGMTSQGGSYVYGTVFKMNTNGTGFTILHNFGSSGDGSTPYGSLTLCGSTLYGMTYQGGSSGWGTVFQINTNGTGYTILHNFLLNSSDGNTPYRNSLTLSGSTLYGMTRSGGSSGDGVVFALQLPSLKAISPNPTNGASNVPTAPLLSWVDGGGGTSYDVYFNGLFKGNQTATNYSPGTLAYNTTYSWRIEPRNSAGVTTGDTWSFTTAPQLPSKAINPSPANGANNISTAPILSWANGGGASSYDVYFNGQSNGNQTVTSYNPGTLASNTLYSWRIDARNSGGATTGDTWTFTTVAQLPSKTINPNPTNGATNASTSVILAWSNGGGATSYDVYFTNQFKTNQTATTYNPGTLAYNTPYSWRIDARNSLGVTSGDAWSFKTEQAHYSYTTNSGKITITGYTGSGGAVVIPSTINGLQVAYLGPNAFNGCTSLTSVTIPNSVTSIAEAAFFSCTSLTNVTIGSGVTSIGYDAFNGCGSLARITIPNNVTSIGEWLFGWCSSLTSVTIGTGLASIGDYAFYTCSSLGGVFFVGSAPSLGGAHVFEGDNNATIYYLPRTNTGWGTTFGSRPTRLWPEVEGFGVRTNRLGFTIIGTSNLVIVVEACTNLGNPCSWFSVGTNTLTNGCSYFTGGSSYFTDPQRTTNYPARFYRLRSP